MKLPRPLSRELHRRLFGGCPNISYEMASSLIAVLDPLPEMTAIYVLAAFLNDPLLARDHDAWLKMDLAAIPREAIAIAQEIIIRMREIAGRS